MSAAGVGNEFGGRQATCGSSCSSLRLFLSGDHGRKKCFESANKNLLTGSQFESDQSSFVCRTGAKNYNCKSEWGKHAFHLISSPIYKQTRPLALRKFNRTLRIFISLLIIESFCVAKSRTDGGDKEKMKEHRGFLFLCLFFTIICSFCSIVLL